MLARAKHGAAQLKFEWKETEETRKARAMHLRNMGKTVAINLSRTQKENETRRRQEVGLQSRIIAALPSLPAFLGSVLQEPSPLAFM